GPQAAYAFWAPPLEDGASLPYSATETGVEMGFNAIVLPEPKVLGVGPKVVPTHKPAKVKIRGRDFMRVIRVSFGGVRAARWTVVNDHLIVARTRATAREGKTHVRVQTAAGTSPATPASVLRFQDPGRR
ncbi:MAG TPA: IPT/TIG domain-containing protein, partial [Solirubrobacterales bacterium]|nr:IPT/TIG domain-containing protein [Solirubrobacterales bacterium]